MAIFCVIGGGERVKKTGAAKREKARALLYLNPEITVRELARGAGVGTGTAHTLKKELIAEDPDEFERIRTEKKQQFISEAWEVVGKALKLADKRFSKALEDEEEIEKLILSVQDHELTQAEKRSLVSRLKALQMTNIRDIAVALGTIYDKQAVASGEPTEIVQSAKPLNELVKETKSIVNEIEHLTS